MSRLPSLGPRGEGWVALQFLLEIRLDEGPIGEDEARRRLRDWWNDRTT